MELDDVLTLIGGMRQVIRSIGERTEEMNISIMESGVVGNQSGIRIYFQELPRVLEKLDRVMDLAIGQLNPFCIDLIPLGTMIDFSGEWPEVDPNDVVLEWIDPSRDRS